VTSLVDRVGEHLNRAFGDQVSRAPNEPAFYVALGRIGVRVTVEPIEGEEGVVDAYSWIGQGLPITPDLALRLAERNAELRFGALCIDGEGAILLKHALFADALSEPVLTRLVGILTETTDALDAELHANSTREVRSDVTP